MIARTAIVAAATAALVALWGAPLHAGADDGVAATGALWVELTPERELPGSIPDATWVRPAAASLVEIEAPAGAPLTVWRVEVDSGGRPTAHVEQLLEPLGGGRHLLWIPPSPRAYLAIAAGARPVRVWALERSTNDAVVRPIERRLWRWAATPEEPLPDLPDHPGLADLRTRLEADLEALEATPAKASTETTARLRRTLLLGRLAWLDPGAPTMSLGRRPARGETHALGDGILLDLEVGGPSLLVVDARARAMATPPPTPVPYDLVLQGRDGDPRARLPTGSLVAPADEPERRSARRRLRFLAPPGLHEWAVLARGTAVDLTARVYRARPYFPSLPDRARLRRLERTAGPSAIPARGTDGPEAAQLALIEGRYTEAQTFAAEVLAEDPAAPAALIVLARAQSRVPPIEGLIPAALPVLEGAVLDGDRAGIAVAGEDLREAAREAWLHATAYVTRGVKAPEPREELVQALPVLHPQTEPDADGRLQPGVFRFLPAGEEVELDPGVSTLDPARWTVVHALGLNMAGKRAVVSLRIDDEPPLRVLLDSQVTPFRLALAPGLHRITLGRPDGAGDRIAVGVDLPTRAPASGPWGEDHPHVRSLKATPLAPDATSGAFALPDSAGTSHLRVEAWWTDDGPQDLVLESAEGERRFQILPTDAPPALQTSDRCDRPGERLSSGSAAIDLTIAAGWVRVRRVAGEGPLWVRISIRAPRPHPVETADRTDLVTPADALPAEGDLRRLSRAVAETEDPVEAAAARAARAELLLGLGLPAYARRDIEQIRSDGGATAGLERLTSSARSIGGPHGTRVHTPPDGPVLPLDLPASLGPGAAAWLDALPEDDAARLVASGDLRAALEVSHHPAAIHMALARRSLDEAARSPQAAIQALLHASAARATVEDPDAARIAQRASDATRPDHLGTAEESPDRVLLGGPSPSPDPLADPARWARWTMLGAPLPHVDQVLASGTRWVVRPGEDAPAELILHAHCDDLRPPLPGAPEACHVELQVGEQASVSWTLPRGRVVRRTVAVDPGSTLALSLAPEGHARYLALALTGDADPWRVADRRAWFHVARPGDPVRYQVTGPTRLVLDAAPQAGTGPISLALLDGDEPLLGLDWAEVARAMVTDQGIAYGPVKTASVNLFGEGPRTLVVTAEGAPVAVRVTHRVPSEIVLPPPPVGVEVPTGDLALRDAVRARVPALVGDRALRLPRPSPAGTLDASVSFWDRWSADLELSDERYQYVQVAALHRLGLGGKRDSWFYGGVLARIGFTAGPSFGLALGTFHRIRPIGLRVNGRALGLIQRTDRGTFGSLALRARLDRPTRLAPDLTLVPSLRIRGYVQPQLELQWFARRLDMELASSYRRAHPFGLGLGADLVWRPWADGAWLLSMEAMGNPELTSLDNAGGHVELRLHPRPFGVAARFHVSHRFADDWRPEGWWRTEVSLGAWADMGPPDLWIRPELRLSYLLDPARLEASVGLAITPGRRAATHFSPADLVFEDLRGPMAVDGRWTR